jgi:two-component system, NtrC family, sensor histidine kinase HydH
MDGSVRSPHTRAWFESAHPVNKKIRPESMMQFSLTRRFAILALLSILAVSVVSAALLSRALAERIIHHDAEVFQSFVDASIPGDVAAAYFAEPHEREQIDRRMQPYLAEVMALPDVVHANAYDPSRKVLWSTKPDMIGKVLPLNPELDEAFEGELEVESNILEDRHYLKPEHIYLVDISHDFVETYVPVWDAGKKNVVGVIEVYRTPRALFDMTWQLIRGVWFSALVGALFLFSVLYWVVRRGDRLIQAQQRQLVEQETMAAVGEMSAAVAHSIRNPLASIRSSAELAQDIDGSVKSAMNDIVAEVDRIAAWIKDLLVYGQSGTGQHTRANLREAVHASLATYQREFDKRGIAVHTEVADTDVAGDHSLMVQVFNSLFSNALEAMPKGGELRVSSNPSADRKRVAVVVADNGEGMSAEQLKRAFVPFSTTKKAGLGIGLPLVKRVVERLGGSAAIESAPSRGTSVLLTLPAK